MKVNMKLLVKCTELYVDPHGSPDEGATTKFITDEESYLIKHEKYYQRDNEVDENDLEGSEDGYNATADYYEVIKITDEQAVEYQKIIDAYNSI